MTESPAYDAVDFFVKSTWPVYTRCQMCIVPSVLHTERMKVHIGDQVDVKRCLNFSEVHVKRFAIEA